MVGGIKMDFIEVLGLFKNKDGLEVGGPSRIFKADGAIPIYPLVETLDGCNFSKNTLWEKGLEDGYNYVFQEDKPEGVK